MRLTCTAIGLCLMVSPAMAAGGSYLTVKNYLSGAVFSTAAHAAQPLTKADMEKLATTYEGHFNKQDAAGIGTLFTKDGVHVNPTGIRNPVEYYGESFKAGFNKLDVTVEQVHQVTADTAIATGTFAISGKDDKGEPLKAGGRWSDTLVNEGGVWKIRMLTGFPIPEKK